MKVFDGTLFLRMKDRAIFYIDDPQGVEHGEPVAVIDDATGQRFEGYVDNVVRDLRAGGYELRLVPNPPLDKRVLSKVASQPLQTSTDGIPQVAANGRTIH